MDKKHIVYVTDMNMGGADSSAVAVPRSGYANIGMELCKGLQASNCDVKVLGLGYTGQEHGAEFSVIPCQSLQDVVGYANNLKYLWKVDAIVVALDIHNFQENLFPNLRKLEIPYICITPLESEPLCQSWASLLSEMSKVFFISQLGADEAVKAGVKAEHIEIGIDTKAWRLRTEEEYQKVRSSMGIEPDEFVVLTVADNQERKNLSAGMQTISKLKSLGVKVKHILITREKSQVGWRLYELAYNEDIRLFSDLTVIPNGIEFRDLYAFYCAADAYLSCSKGEGLGLPIMEAMAVGVPVVANKTGALTELLSDQRGWLVDHTFWHYDPFGNQKRYYIDVDQAADKLFEIRNLLSVNPQEVLKVTARARAHMESRSWSKSVRQLRDAVEVLSSEA